MAIVTASSAGAKRTVFDLARENTERLKDLESRLLNLATHVCGEQAEDAQEVKSPGNPVSRSVIQNMASDMVRQDEVISSCHQHIDRLCNVFPD